MQSTDNWTLKTKGSLVYVENGSNDTILNITDDGKVIQDTSTPNETGQLWLKRKSNEDGYFILTNPQTQKILTAGSDHHFEIIGTYLDNRYTLQVFTCTCTKFDLLLKIYQQLKFTTLK